MTCEAAWNGTARARVRANAPSRASESQIDEWTASLTEHCARDWYLTV
jgi:hypothetical protein